MARGTRLTFYADRDDMTVLFAKMRELGDFTYTPLYWDEDDACPSLSDPSEIPQYGYLRDDEDCLCSKSYLIIRPGEGPNQIRFVLDSGKVRYKIDNATNPSSVRFCVGGDAGDRTLVASQIDTLGLTAQAIKLQLLFAKVVRDQGFKVDNYRVLPGALAKLQDGWRLTTGKGYASSQDLRSG